MEDYVSKIKQLGFSDKSARFYVAAWELGQASILEISKRARLQRTTLYYTLRELQEVGAIYEVKVGKKLLYKAVTPTVLAKQARERVIEFEDMAAGLTALQGQVFKKPKVSYLYGVAGFKDLWDRILSSPSKEFSILTDGESFLDYVKERYVLANIIGRKQREQVYSRQLIPDTPFAHKIIKKDRKENRSSRLLPSQTKLSFTEVICDDFVALLGSRSENLIMVLENKSLAKTRRVVFDLLWSTATQV
ncbi:MAG TPA: helix-turn-helix domain-containing protein [Patescibacteria group bacterium]|nr:helix-turn-helix domain-containing protein [Patescibacteria group bacterium]